jgi:hypothetical protein
MGSDRAEGRAERRAAVIGAASVALLAAAIVSDFVIGSFWAKHAMLTSLLASMLIVVISVAVVNELIERRERRRWSLLAQGVMFALVQSARLTWTSLVEVLRLTEVHTGSVESLLSAARVALDRGRVSEATRGLLADPERRQRLQRVLERLSDHTGEVIAKWATVLVGAAPYAALLDGHVELQGRLEWLTSVLGHREPADEGGRSPRLTRASIATEHADEFDDDWIHDMVVSITARATQLDYNSRELAFELVAADWWNERTQALIDGSGAPAEL